MHGGSIPFRRPPYTNPMVRDASVMFIFTHDYRRSVKLELFDETYVFVHRRNKRTRRLSLQFAIPSPWFQLRQSHWTNKLGKAQLHKGANGELAWSTPWRKHPGDKDMFPWYQNIEGLSSVASAWTGVSAWNLRSRETIKTRPQVKRTPLQHRRPLVKTPSWCTICDDEFWLLAKTPPNILSVNDFSSPVPSGGHVSRILTFFCMTCVGHVRMLLHVLAVLILFWSYHEKQDIGIVVTLVLGPPAPCVFYEIAVTFYTNMSCLRSS